MLIIPLFLTIVWCCRFAVVAELSSGRIKGKDEPQLVSWKVLEGITEPFGTNYENSIPVWKQMKAAADQKAANMAMQQALHEYGQILRHPYVFGEMPAEERYDVFLSMAKLLKMMGFHQRAEVILHEAMTHTSNAYEANFQLGLLFLDKEDLESAKMYLKNCLFYQESDLLILSYLTMILITEGKIHEATFFLSRIILGLEERVRKLSFILSESEIQAMQAKMDYKQLANWLEDTIVKVFYGEFHITPSATIETLKYFSNLYQWIQSGEMIGRFVFDLGQSLYEGGRSKVGLMMMKRGFETSSIEEEGIVSHEITKLRLAFECPIVPSSLLEVIESYLNMTTFLSSTSKNYTKIDIENVMDMYWPIPLLGWSGLPVMPVQRELLWRFSKGLSRTDAWANEWLKISNHELIESTFLADYGSKRRSWWQSSPAKKVSLPDDIDVEEEIGEYEDLKAKSRKHASKQTVVIPPSDNVPTIIPVNVGIFGGHFNNHPVGQMILQNIIQQIQDDSMLMGEVTKAGKSAVPIHLTLLSLPLIPDTITKRIANKVDRIVNIPMDTRQAMKLLQELKLDVVLFPDWQPFPDQQSLVFQSLRIAPVQICFYVRGTSCASDAIDYYLLPEEIANFYVHSVPAAASNATRQLTQSVPVHTTSSTSPNTTNRVIKRPLRPAWRELFLEQVILVEHWPILTSLSIESSIQLIQTDHSVQQNRKIQASQHHLQSSSSSFSSTGSSHSSSGSGSSHSHAPDFTGSLTSLAIMEDYFSPNEYEGKIFFKDQPVAILPIYPHYIHPLMDEMVFKLLRAIPVLQILLVIPDTFLSHVRDVRHKLSWARKLVRRLWDKGGTSLSHRIRLLPSTFSDYRMVQLIRQTDIVLDTYPFGSTAFFLGVALSVGTPVITLASGSRLITSRDDLQEIKQYLTQSVAHHGLYKDHPLRMLINSQSEIPWISSMSNVAGFYERVGLQSYLIANSINEYFVLAEKLLGDREYAYELRVKLLDALDLDVNQDNLGEAPSTSRTKTTSTASTTPTQNNLGTSSITGKTVDGLSKVLYELGAPWAYAREKKVVAHAIQQEQKRKRRDKPIEGFDDFLRSTMGSIIH